MVCHCTDCQFLTRYLGCADRILDQNQGSALYQSRCAAMRIEGGGDQLACVHLTEKPTLRWFARCCRAPLFNTYANGRIPYVTTQVAICDPATRDSVLGQPIGHLFLEDVAGDTGTLPRLSMAKLMRRFFPRMVRDWMSGDRRRSALFDPRTLEPIVEPHRLTGNDRARHMRC